MIDNLFIDTSVFVKHNYLNGIVIKSLLNLSKDNVIKIYLTDFSYREVLSNMFNDLKAAEDLTKKKEFSTLKHFNSVNSIFSNINHKVLFERFKEDFKSYITVYKINILENKIADIDFVIDSYFNKTPPFSDKKRNEFPDAIIVSTVMEHFAEKKEECLFLCYDNDFSNLPCEHIKPFDMSTITAYIQDKEMLKDALMYDKVESARYLISNHIPELKKEIILFLHDVEVDYEPFILFSPYYPLTHDFIKYKFDIEHFEVLNGNNADDKIYFSVNTKGYFEIDFHVPNTKNNSDYNSLITETKKAKDVSLTFQGVINIDPEDSNKYTSIEISTVNFSNKLLLNAFYDF